MLEECSFGNRLVGLYRGKVLKHLSNGFCKIWIPGVYPEEWNSYDAADSIPSAEQASPLSFGANEGLGVFSYPSIGSTVWCFFANGDQNYPVYFATTLGGEKAIANWDSARPMVDEYPDDAYVHKIHVKNTDIEVSETGYVKVTTTNSGAKTAFTLDSQGNVAIDCTNKISLKADNIVLDAKNQINLNTGYLSLAGQKLVSVTGEAVSINAKSGHCTIKSLDGKEVI